MKIDYLKNYIAEYPYEAWFPYNRDFIDLIKKKISFAQRSYNPNNKHWLFTEEGFKTLVLEYSYSMIAKGLTPKIEEHKTELITNNVTSTKGFDLNIARSWFAKGYAPMQIQEEFISKPCPDGYGLFFECGCGKTATAVCEFFRRRHEKRAHRMFVIVWRTTLTKNWQEDVKKLFNYDIDVVDGKMSDRASEIENTESLIVVTPFTTLRDEASINMLIKKFDMGVFDECHCAVSDRKTRKKKDEHGNTKKTKTGFWGLTQLCKNIKNRLALTGTPMPNKAINAYTALMICDPVRFPSKIIFTNRYAELNRFGKPIGYKNLNELKSFLSYYGMIALKKDICDLQPKIEKNIYCEMSAQTEKILREAIHVQIGKVFDRLALDDYYIKIHQLIACPTTYYDFNSDKIDIIKDYIDNDIPKTEQIIVFTSFRGSVKEIVSALGKHRCAVMIGGMNNKDETIEYESFRSAKKQILVCTTTKMGVGYNLQCASHCFMYDTAMSGADYEQAISRAYRIGQKNSVMIYNVLMDIPFDINRQAIINEQRKLWTQMSDTSQVMMSSQKIKLLSTIIKGQKQINNYSLSQFNKDDTEPQKDITMMGALE
ncbi:MAG: DEAD/DEAH box helicase [Christensenellaceae bacterium]|jgi:superfamily II DNA or RNA helicase|nr:DEAD/DEAH box helicase [Christensenellaceae bacterium]